MELAILPFVTYFFVFDTTTKVFRRIFQCRLGDYL